MMDHQRFADWLRTQLENKGWKQAEFARRSELSQQHISRILNCVGSPGSDFYKGTARALRLPLDEVMAQAGLMRKRGDVLPEARNWSQRIESFSEDEQRAILAAVEAVLSAFEIARQQSPSRQESPPAR